MTIVIADLRAGRQRLVTEPLTRSRARLPHSAFVKNIFDLRRDLVGPLFFMLTLAALGPTACNQVAAPEDMGQLNLSIILPDGGQIPAVDWTIHASTGAVILYGTINTSNPKALPGFVAALPAATGDTLTMSATTTTGVSCAGTSAPFDVTAGVTSNVAVNITCNSIMPDAGTGLIIAHGTVVAGDSCPNLTSSLVSPQQTGLANPIDVMATASDSDVSDTLTYAWSATAGTFTSASSASTQYHCPATAGTQTLTLTITDNHAPTPCATVVTFPAVDCQ
jgi:hypothetical protein